MQIAQTPNYPATMQEPHYGTESSAPIAKTPRGTNPIAKRTKKLRSNLGDPTSRCDIHRRTYQNYLLVELDITESLVERMLKLHKEHISRETIDRFFPMTMEQFHKVFLIFLKAL